MKYLSVILLFVFYGLSAQVETIPTVTGVNPGDGEVKLIVAAAQTNDDYLSDTVDENALLIAVNLAKIDSSKLVFNYEDSTAATITVGSFSTGNFIDDEYDLIIGDNDTASVLKIGNLEFGTSDDRTVGTSLTAGGVVYFVVQNQPDGIGEFIFCEANGTIRFALPSSGWGYGTYNPRSMIIAGPSVMEDSIMIGSYWGFNRIYMDTGGNGADLGVQNNIQVGDSAFVNTAIVLGGDQFDAQSDSIIFKPDSIIFTNGASFENNEADTFRIRETVVMIEGGLVTTGHVYEGEHASGGSYVSTPGTQTIGTGGTFERLNEGAIAYTGMHLHEFTHSDGRLTYTSADTISMTANATISVESGEVAQEIQFRLAKNGSTIAGTNMQVEFTAVNGNSAIPLLWALDMAQNDYIEVWGTSDTNGDDFIINNLTLFIAKH